MKIIKLQLLISIIELLERSGGFSENIRRRRIKESFLLLALIFAF
jgi:hypothetical protein